MQPTASLAVLIYNFAGMPFQEPGRARLGGRAGAGVPGARRQPHRPEPVVASDSAAVGDSMSCATRNRSTRERRSPARPTALRKSSSTATSRSSTTATSRRCATPRFRSRSNAITAFIGPSGCGKSTVLRCLNRMNDLVRGFRFEGHVHYRGKDIYASQPSIRSPCAATSAWCSSSRTRSRRASTTTSRSACG